MRAPAKAAIGAAVRTLASGVAVACAASVSFAADGADGTDPRLHVLFLGDHGHHDPAERAQEAYAPLARAGIVMDFTFERSDLRSDLLARYDALVIYANHDEIAPAEEKALLDFVESGHGLVALHCASYCFRNSPKYLALVGGQFDHHSMGEFTARTIAPGHEALLDVADFKTTDETYVHQSIAQDIEVLQVRDEQGKSEPYTWVRQQGKGRVYYTALGHDERTWTQPQFEEQLAQAIRWAAGQPDFKWEGPKTELGDVNLPNYRPDLRWGQTAEPIRKLQLPLSPVDEQRLLQVPAGFDVSCFASEPQIVKPIALSFDAHHRAWIAEALDYPNNQQPPGQGHDDVKILIPSDDGSHVIRTQVFADKLSLVTSVVCVPHGCIVAQMPDVLLLQDQDGDDVCDERRVLFTGFGTGDTHAGPSNFRLGPDGWIWGTVGYSGFRGEVGGEHLEFAQAVFRFKPDGSKLERVASTSNNTWGLGFSSHGEVFASTANGEHLVHVVLPAQALELLPGLPTNATTHVEDHEKLHSLLPLRQVDYFGGFTAACNAAISTSPDFPPEYFDRVAFVCEPTGHVVHRCLLEPKGATFTSHDGWNMLASQDEWTAPIAAEPGPDGALWVLDWYTPVVQHNPTPRGFQTGKGNAYETPHRDKQHGRIWRIGWRGATDADRLAIAAEKKRREDEANRSTIGVYDEHRIRARDLFWPSPELRLPDRFEGAAFGGPLDLPSHADERARRLLDFVSDSANGRDDWPALAATIEASRVWQPFLEAALAPDANGSAAREAAEKPVNLLANPSAEELDGVAPRNWRSMTYGGEANFDVAPPAHAAGHSGAHALHVASQRGADASWSQSVKVVPNATYRLTGWIKTDKIEPRGGANGALFNVHELQTPKLVKTPAVVGTHDWTKVEVTFESGDHTALTINALLGGWGPASGNAWFDDLSLELIATVAPRLRSVRAIAAFAAKQAPADALTLLPQLSPAPADAATAVLEGFALGWPRGKKELVDAKSTEALRALPAQLAPPARAALLVFAERIGALELFPKELAALADELRAKLAAADVATDEKAEAARRLLSLAPGEDSARRVAAGLTTMAEPDLAKAFVAALGESGVDAAGAALLERVPQLTPQATALAVEVLLRRTRWQQLLLTDVLAGRIDKKLIATDVLDRLLKSGDADVARLAAEVAKRAGRVPNPDRQKLLEKWLPVADKPGDSARGAVVFGEQCAKCHSLNGKGGVVGPDLTNIGTRGKHDLLLEILDPNRSVEGTYRAYDVTLKNGDDFSGRLVGESRATLELLDATGTKHVIARDDVKEVAALTRSLMPEGFEELGEADLGGLLEFLTRIARPGR